MKNVLIIVFFIASCTVIRSQNFKIIEATKQWWAGGIRGSGTGITYKLTLITLQPSEKMTIDRLWVGDKYFEVKAVRMFPKPAGFGANDTVYVMATIRFPGERMPTDEEPPPVDSTQIKAPELLPFKYDGEALLGYRIGKKRKYFVIKTISKQEDLYHE